MERLGTNDWKVDASGLTRSDIPPEQARRIRAAILFAGPLLARTGRAVLAPPGGDVIGRRRLDTHFLALEELGARVGINGEYTFTASRLKGTDIFLDEASVTATENAIMAAALAEGTTILRNAASEPHVQDLCRLVNAMGGHVAGIGSNILTIEGVQKLHGADFTIGPDFMEIGSFIGLAAVTRGELTIENVEPDDLRMMRIAFAKLGIRWQIEGRALHMAADQPMAVNPDLGGQIPKIDDAPWPGFPPDLTSIITVVATQVAGTVLVHEKLFESRMFFVDKLIGMGAKIILCDPHRAVVTGPARLNGSTLVSPGRPGGHGHGDRRHVRPGPQHHPQRLPDRAGATSTSPSGSRPSAPASSACRTRAAEATDLQLVAGGDLPEVELVVVGLRIERGQRRIQAGGLHGRSVEDAALQVQAREVQHRRPGPLGRAELQPAGPRTCPGPGPSGSRRR